jgi:hypothetical protein
VRACNLASYIGRLGSLSKGGADEECAQARYLKRRAGMHMQW